jgi:hypothetical protein
VGFSGAAAEVIGTPSFEIEFRSGRSRWNEWVARRSLLNLAEWDGERAKNNRKVFRLVGKPGAGWTI